MNNKNNHNVVYADEEKEKEKEEEENPTRPPLEVFRPLLSFVFRLGVD